MAVKTIEQMTEAEIAQYLQNRKAEQAKLVREQGVKARAELETYCLAKYKMTLTQIFTASEKNLVKQYRHPQTGAIYTYSGRGKLPNWLKGADGQLIPVTNGQA